MVLGKLPVPGRPTNLDWSRARAYCAFSRCGLGLFGHFDSHPSFLSSFSLSFGLAFVYSLPGTLFSKTLSFRLHRLPHYTFKILPCQ